MKIYAVHDKQGQEYSSIMMLPTDAHAVRSFTQEVNRKDTGNMLNQFPEHFALYTLGDIDTETGTITPENTKLLEAIAAMRPTETR